MARIGLANYFAGAFLLPYRHFRPPPRTAVRHRPAGPALRGRIRDDLPSAIHSAAPGRRGIPSSSSGPTAPETSRSVSPPLHFTSPASAATVRCGWCTTPSRSPDGSSPRWRRCPTVGPISGSPDHRPAAAYLGPQKSFAIGLGCDLAHADKLIYSAGIDLDDPTTTVPIGAGCKICDRPPVPSAHSRISAAGARR